MEKKIKAAAIIGHDGKVYSLPVPARHHDIIKYLARYLKHPIPIKGEQGFITDQDEFVTREEAKIIAKNAGQLLDRASQSDQLFSECVWYGAYDWSKHV